MPDRLLPAVERQSSADVGALTLEKIACYSPTVPRFTLYPRFVPPESGAWGSRATRKGKGWTF